MLVYWILIRLRHFLMTQCVCVRDGGGATRMGWGQVGGGVCAPKEMSIVQSRPLLYSTWSFYLL